MRKRRLCPLLLCSPRASGALSPGFRNEFHAGLEQAFGKYLVFSGEWISKYTHNGYDFSVLGNTPITFPIEWHNSKIPGYAGRVSVPKSTASRRSWSSRAWQRAFSRRKSEEQARQWRPGGAALPH